MRHDDIGGMRELAFRRLEVAKEDLETLNVKAVLCDKYRAAFINVFEKTFYMVTHGLGYICCFCHVLWLYDFK